MDKENKGRLIIISGSAGSGKGTVIKRLFESEKKGESKNKYKYSVSATTRAPRNGEVNGADYFFMSRAGFSAMAERGELLEYVEYSGNMYGTPALWVERTLSEGYCVILEIEVFGAMRVKAKKPGAASVFLAPPSFAELAERLRSRGTETPEVIERRLEISRDEIKRAVEYDYFLINEAEKADVTAKLIDEIAYAERMNIKSVLAEECRAGKERLDKFLQNYYTDEER